MNAIAKSMSMPALRRPLPGFGLSLGLGLGWLGVMAGRSHRAERVARLTCDHGVDRGNHRAGSPQRSLARTG